MVHFQHTYLREKGEKVTSEPWEGFVITKQLTKMPHEYADAKSQPHVQVRAPQFVIGPAVLFYISEAGFSALMANRGCIQVAIKMMEQEHVQVQAGQSIQYIVVEGNTSSVAERSMSPKTFLAAGESTKIDYAW